MLLLLRVLMHACNPSIWEAEVGGSGAANPGYIVRLCLNKQNKTKTKTRVAMSRNGLWCLALMNVMFLYVTKYQ